MKKKKLLLAAAVAAAYLLLVVLLLLAESESPDASINSFPLALWFSLTTLTTVGYGDLYPVTMFGHIIAAVFQLLSLGVLAMLIGTAVSVVRTRLLPLMKLRLLRKKEWFVFLNDNEAAMSLASALHKENPDSAIIFCGELDAEGNLSFAVRTQLDPAALAKQKKNGEDISVFCMSYCDAENERLAHSLEDTPCSVYCMSEYEPDLLPESQHRFDPYDCCARLYWRRFPVRCPRERIVIIGSGKYAEAILEQALQRNVVSDSQSLTYELFGDYTRFRLDHPYLSGICAMNEQAEDGDSLFFRSGPWNAFPKSLEKSDRIIFCFDTEEETIETLTELKRFFPVSAALHAKLSAEFDGVDSFGSMEEIFTPELVIRSRLNKTAMELNEIYRSSTGENAPQWSDMNSFLRRSNIASAEHLGVKIWILLGDGAKGVFSDEELKTALEKYNSADEEKRMKYLKIEHERWMRFHILNNWQYAPQRDNKKRLHPMLVPFESLSFEEKLKDEYGWKLLEALVGK